MIKCQGLKQMIEPDTALRHQAWLQSLKPPSNRAFTALQTYIQANRTMLSEADAQYIAEENRPDLVALTWKEKEVLSLVMEKHLSKIFKKKASASPPCLVHFIDKPSRMPITATTSHSPPTRELP